MEKKHREKIRNTGKTQGKHREFYLGSNVATLTNVCKNNAKICVQQAVVVQPMAGIHTGGNNFYASAEMLKVD